MLSTFQKKSNVLLAATLLMGSTLMTYSQSFIPWEELWKVARPPMESLDESDYKGWKQVWAVTQGKNEYIYAANAAGVLEYNGVQWRIIPLNILTVVRDVTADSEGTIYVAAANELGYLAPDSLGALQYQSLKPLLDSAYHDFGTIWHVYAIGEAVYFLCGKYLLKYSQGSFRVWKPRSGIGFGFCVNNNIYYEDRGVGITELDGDSLKLLPNPGLPNRGTVFMAEHENGVLLGHANNGFIVFGDETQPVYKDPSRKEVLKMNRLYGGMRLQDGNYLAYSLGDGVMIFNREGRIIRHFSQSTGLPTDVIYNAFQDRSGSIWLSTDKGITRIDLAAPTRILDHQHGLPESVHDLEVFQGKIYLGLNVGLYYLDPTEEFVAKKVPETKNIIRSILKIDDDMIINHFDTLMWLNKDGRWRHIEFATGTFREILTLPGDPSKFMAYNREGYLHVFAKDQRGQWIKNGPSISVGDYIAEIHHGPQGTLWVGTVSKGLVRYDHLAEYFSDQRDTFRRTDIQLDEAFPSFAYIDNRLYVGTTQEVLTWDPSVDSLVPLLEPPRGGVAAIDRFDRGVVCMTQGQGKYPIYLLRGDSFILQDWNLLWPNFQVLELFEPKEKFILALGPDGILVHREDFTPQSELPQVQVSSVFLNDFQVAGDHLTASVPELNYRKNRVRINYALPYYLQAGANEYQIFLDGYDDSWSSWSPETFAIYTNLPPGLYDFQVRAKNVWGTLSQKDSLAFVIKTPWHRTWWAYTIYFLLGLLGVLGIVRWRSRQLRKEKLALQNLVNLRTAELQIQNERLEEQKVQLAKQAEELKEVDKMKSRLLTNISHEFRTPLTLIKGPVDQLVRFPGTVLTARKIRALQRNADRLLRLVNQLLALSKLDTGSLPLNLTEGDVYRCLRAATSAFSSHAAQRSVDYIVRIPLMTLWASFDRDKMEEVVYNLLSNAFKFTPDGGTIVFAADYRNGILNLEVSDDGVGIPSRDQAHIFDRFYQVDSSSTRSSEGSGIGLSLVREFVELMEGQITLESEIGKGTTFFVSIPLRKIEGEHTLIKGEDGDRPQKHALTLPLVDDSEFGEGQEEAQKVLIVEDNADMRDYVVEQLQDQFEILEAINGPEGLRIATDKLPDLIVTDIMMPEMDGMQLCEILKSDQRTSHIPIVMLTAKAGLENRLEGLETGADAYLTKPFHVRELQVTVKNLIEQRAKLRDLFSTGDPFSPSEIDLPSLDQKFMAEVLNLLEENYGQVQFGVPDMQQEMAMSKTQLYRKLKALTGYAPGEFLRSYRLKRAAQILEKGESVTQTAYAVGFNNLSYFAKCFKEYHGVSPKEYANS